MSFFVLQSKNLMKLVREETKLLGATTGANFILMKIRMTDLAELLLCFGNGSIRRHSIDKYFLRC